MWVLTLGREDPLEEEGMATHSSILAWEFHRQSSHQESDTTEVT